MLLTEHNRLLFFRLFLFRDLSYGHIFNYSCEYRLQDQNEATPRENGEIILAGIEKGGGMHTTG